ncbi:hypothetical protein ACFL1G_10165 [Planctomycetota bacterium]
MKHFKNYHFLVIAALLLCSFAAKAGALNEAKQRNVFAEKGFIHILGPNPAIITGDKDAWDGWNIESADIIKHRHTYYWYYHGRGIKERENIQKSYKTGKREHPMGYRIGIATAPTPLGPWTKYENNPILDYGPLDTWDGGGNACATVLKAREPGEGNSEKFYMWYNNIGGQRRAIGLATAPHPLGPWKRYEGNPIVEWPAGWLCSVMEVNGKLHMYHGGDGVKFSLATADKPEGPWTMYEHNPLMTRGDWSAWDDGGHSEGKVLYHEGVFHFFYGGSHSPPPGTPGTSESLESIGYAYSFDGYKFNRYAANPVVLWERTPDTSAYGEVQALVEPPFIYLYHTIRYISRDLWTAPRGEDLGIQVLSTNPHFRLSMPILNLDLLDPKKHSLLENCCPVSLQAASNLALTIECNYNAEAKAGLRMHIISSYDGINYDTTDLYTFDNVLQPGRLARKTFHLESKAKFITVLVENLDENESVSDVKITATLGG